MRKRFRHYLTITGGGCAGFARSRPEAAQRHQYGDIAFAVAWPLRILLIREHELSQSAISLDILTSQCGDVRHRPGSQHDFLGIECLGQTLRRVAAYASQSCKCEERVVGKPTPTLLAWEVVADYSDLA